MTITQIKQQLDIVSLDLVRGIDPKTNQPTQWLRYWDNNRRLAVVVHEDVVKAIKENSNLTTLAIKSSEEVPEATEKNPNPQPYYNHILINAKSIEFSL
jgi:hypothetical protein